jgi:hypothetical protein
VSEERRGREGRKEGRKKREAEAGRRARGPFYIARDLGARGHSDFISYY